MRKLIVLVSILLAGCVTTIPMAEQSPDLSYMNEDKIVISVIDERRRVREGGKPPNFVGVAHGTFGIPSDWHVYPVLTGFEKENRRDTFS